MLSVSHRYHHHHNTAITDELCIPNPGAWERALNEGSHVKGASIQSLALPVLYIASFSLHFKTENFYFPVLDTLLTAFFMAKTWLVWSSLWSVPSMC